MTKTTFTAALLIALAVPLRAQAACETSDLAGRWKAYSTGQSTDIGPYIQECTVIVNSRGEIFAIVLPGAAVAPKVPE
jgi:hypothetical protein